MNSTCKRINDGFIAICITAKLGDSIHEQDEQESRDDISSRDVKSRDTRETTPNGTSLVTGTENKNAKTDVLGVSEQKIDQNHLVRASKA
ncbi:hypothetical protein DPMN_072927 [Dreissena polymorpha]|uniref:Uncharacterized protein n=1 Tax=Dreissena polymorpha TaxID=45954 RepID=A0A9D4HCF6_DREPO|nr:hypothetical protein DPMN_072927 [Dreissena polymorpha]